MSLALPYSRAHLAAPILHATPPPPPALPTRDPQQLGRDVTNCHKIPAYNFDRRIVSVDEIAQALQRSLASVLRANPDARVLLTVSPVRHWRDGPVENARSKAHLLAGAHAAIELLRAAGVGKGVGEGGAGRVSYFPSFEIVNDDLRDYRFFEPDMIHPNSVAVDYIWDKLVGSMFSDDTIRTMQEVRRSLCGILGSKTQNTALNDCVTNHSSCFLVRSSERISRSTHPDVHLPSASFIGW